MCIYLYLISSLTRIAVPPLAPSWSLTVLYIFYTWRLKFRSLFNLVYCMTTSALVLSAVSVFLTFDISCHSHSNQGFLYIFLSTPALFLVASWTSLYTFQSAVSFQVVLGPLHSSGSMLMVVLVVVALVVVFLSFPCWEAWESLFGVEF